MKKVLEFIFDYVFPAIMGICSIAILIHKLLN